MVWLSSRWLQAVAIATSLCVANAAHGESCRDELVARKISFKKIDKKGIADAIEVTGPLGGVTYKSDDQKLVLDCSLALSLDEAGKFLTGQGIQSAYFSSAYSRRNVRGTNRPSKHSFGLAIDVHRFSGDRIGTVRLDRDFEQGLGDNVRCIGEPLTEAGAILKILQCQFAHSGLFTLVLSPDYDDAHHDHFHLEVLPWSKRPSLRSDKPAIF